MAPLFIATERFDQSEGQAWDTYAQWAKIPQLIEVVSLDSSLCGHLIGEFADEDWKHNVQENFRLGYFYHLDYLMSRVATVKRKNVLGLYRNPERHIEIPPGPGGFIFLGYDLIEEMTQISALTNCGGFPETFANEELNEFGLLFSFERASEVRTLLATNNPEEPHAHCEMYAIWRLKAG